jgi:ABC-type Fe3+-hydroxamate transport system substrate-binding protein
MLQKAFRDMLGREVVLNSPPKRIISLVPSQTELLYDLGLKDIIVGQTKFCIHPTLEFKNAVKIGGTKVVKHDLIDALKPDLIIGNKEENTQEIIDTLSLKYPVWVSDILTIEDNYQMIESIGDLCHVEIKAQTLINEIKFSFNQLKDENIGTCLYLIWKNPYMAAGENTFINEMLKKAGFQNVLEKNSRYPELTESEIVTLNPQYIFLSSEPFPFKDKHIESLQLLLPNAIIKLVDGEMFSWYGSRIKLAPKYFKQLVK